MVEVAEEFVEAVVRRQELVPIAQVVLAELTRGIAEGLSACAMVMSRAWRPIGAPKTPTFVRPVRNADCPVMNVARPRCNCSRRSSR